MTTTTPAAVIPASMAAADRGDGAWPASLVVPALTGMSLSVVMLVAVAEIDVFATAATIYGNLKCTDMLLFTAISSVTLASMSVAMPRGQEGDRARRGRG